MALAIDSRGLEYRQSKAAALRTMCARHPWLSQDERLDIYNEVWTRLLERQRDQGFWPDKLEAYLVGAVDKRARHEARARANHKTDPADPLNGALPASPDGPMDEQVHGRLDAESLRAVIAGLSPLQQAISKLRFDWQLAPREIASLLGIEVKRCYRELEYATARLRREARKVERGEHVRRYEKVLRRHLAGTASEAERAEALRLIETSSQARMIASEMRRQALQLGALLPVPALDAAEPQARIAEVLVGIKEQAIGARGQVSDAVAGAKQHATSAYSRVVDPTPLSGVRPGAAVTAVASCLALGGGTAVCVEEGINPIKEVASFVAPEEEQADPKSSPLSSGEEIPADPAVPTAPIAPEVPQAGEPTAPAPKPSAPGPNAPVPADAGPEFLPGPVAPPPTPAGGGGPSPAAPPQAGGEFAP